jgi:hypothetical protein
VSLKQEKEVLMNMGIELEINVSIPENQKISIEIATNSIWRMELNGLVTKKIIEEYQELLVLQPQVQRERRKRA